MIKNSPVSVFKALADQQRLRILNILLDGEICVGDLVTVLGEPQPTISRHLRILKSSELIVGRKQGLWVFYSLSQPTLGFSAAIQEAWKLQAQDDPQMSTDRQLAQQLRQEDGCCPSNNPTGPCGPKS